MEDAYLDKIDSYSGQKVQFVDQNAMEATTVEVKSVVQPADSSDQPIQINYLVKQTEGGWKVYDVTVDDISITANYRNQFTRMIDQQWLRRSHERDAQKAAGVASIDRRITLRFIGWSVCRTSITRNNAAYLAAPRFPGALPAFPATNAV